MEEKAQGQQYLKPYKEEVIVKYLLQMSDLGHLIRMKFIPSLAYSVTRIDLPLTGLSRLLVGTGQRL
jgi:hypothetical protein